MTTVSEREAEARRDAEEEMKPLLEACQEMETRKLCVYILHMYLYTVYVYMHVYIIFYQLWLP